MDYEACGDTLTLDFRERQLPDESVVMRQPTRAYQTGQPSASRPFCYQYIARRQIPFVKNLTGQYISVMWP